MPRLPYPFLIPRPPAIVAFERLVTHVPTRFAAFYQVHKPRLITTIRVVVPGKEIAVVVEGQLLRISQTMMEDFETRSIEFTTERRTGVGRDMLIAFTIKQVVSPVTNGPIQPAVRSEYQTVHVMTTQSRSNAKAGLHDFAFFGNTIAVEITQPPEVWDIGDPDITPNIQNAGHGSFKRFIESRSKFSSALKSAVTVDINQARKSVVPPRVIRHAAVALTRPFLVHGQTILKRLEFEVVHQPPRGRTVVFNALLLASRFAHQECSLVINGERNRITHQGFSRHDPFGASSRDLHQLEGFLNRDLGEDQWQDLKHGPPS